MLHFHIFNVTFGIMVRTGLMEFMLISSKGVQKIVENIDKFWDYKGDHKRTIVSSGTVHRVGEA